MDVDGWWQQGLRDLGMSEDQLDGLPKDPYDDFVVLTDLETADLAVAELGRYQRELQLAEAARIGGLLRAYEAVRTQDRDLGRRWDDVAERSFVLQAALLLKIGERTALSWLHTAMDLRDRFGRSWQRFQAGEVPWRSMQLVVQQAEGLDEQHWAAYDDAASRRIGAIPPSRLREVLHRIRERLQVDTAVARTRAALRRRAVVLDALPDGVAALSVTAAAADTQAVHDGLHAAALAMRSEDESRTVPQLMSDIAMDLLLEGLRTPPPEAAGVRAPNRRPVTPQVFLEVPVLTLLGHSSEPARLSGYGPIDVETAKRLCADAPSFTRLLVDPVDGVRLDLDRTTYRPPTDVKRWLALRDGTCRAPGCNRPAWRCDVDHVQRWADGGRTGVSNLAHLCRRHHRLKESGRWNVVLTDGGDQRWTSPWGPVYVTRPVEQSPPQLPPHLKPADGAPPF